MAVADLPEEILFNHILCRLPVKSTLCFRSVCKAWNRMLREQKFVKLHLKIHQQQACNNKNKELLIKTHVRNFYSIDCDEEAVKNRLAVPPPHIPGEMVSERTQLLGSCNGLVAIIDGNGNTLTSSTLVLWNPSTGESKYLPYTCPIIKNDHLFGFVYDSILDDYKIIRIITSMYEECEADMYSLRKNSWQKVKGEPSILSLVNPTQLAGVELNGYLYWMVWFPRSGSDPSVTGFCLRDESFTSLNCPIQMSSLSYYHGPHGPFMGLKAMGRLCLAASYFYKNNKFLVSTLKDPERRENKWEKLIILSLSSPELLLTCLIRPLWLTKDCKVLLIIGFNTGNKNDKRQHNFGVYDPQKKSLEFVQIYGIKNTCDVMLTTETEYIPSLVSPNMFESGRQGIDMNMHQVIDTKMHQDICAKKRMRG